MQRQKDQRFLKSEQAIQTAFFQLMKKEGFTHLHVRDLIQMAQINRTTFYSHYTDKYDLLNQQEYKLLKELRSVADQSSADFLLTSKISDMDQVILYAHDSVKYLRAHAVEYSLLLGPQGDHAFPTKLQNTIAQAWQDRGLFKHLKIPQDYAISAVTGMVISLIQTWIKNDFRENSNDFVQIVAKVVQGFSSYTLDAKDNQHF